MNEQDDLTPVLTNVALDAKPATRARIINSAETRAFLDVGLLLLRDDLLDHRGPNLMDDDDAGTRLFAGLSQARLVERAAQEDAHREQPRVLTVGMFRDRWRYKSRYTEDLIAYLLRPALIEPMLRDISQVVTTLPADLPLVDAIRQLSLVALGETVTDPLWRLQLIIRVALPNHPRVRAFSEYRYDEWIPAWAAIFEEVGTHYRLELRPDYTWVDVAEIFHALGDGARLRVRSLGSVAELSSGENVLAGAVIGMIHGLLVDASAGDL